MNIDSIKPTAAVALADKARELELTGKSIIKLQTGDPDFGTHKVIVDAAYDALQKGLTHYSFSQGLPELRDQIAAAINSELTGAETDRNWVLISNGAAEGIYATMAGLLEQHDEVIILEPNWPTVDSLATLMGASVKKINSFTGTAEIISQLDAAWTIHTKLLCFNSPNNPTGQVYSQQLIDAVCNWAIQKNIYILADEVYRFLQFGDEITTSLKNLTSYKKYIYADSFSKKYAMTGWRIGYIVSHPETLKRISKASQLTVTHVAPFVQKAAHAALTSSDSLAYSHEMRNTYNERRLQLMEKCVSLGLELVEPAGGFYLFIKLGKNIDDLAFCDRMLEEKDTCIVPGSAFGATGKNHVRISYATTIENSLRGLERIAEMLKNYTN